MNPINNISIPNGMMTPGQVLGKSTAGQETTSFKDFLVDSINEVNSMQQSADRAVEQLPTGGDVNPAEVLTAVQKADVTFRLMVQVRNTIVQAYNEVQNIRI